MKEQWAAIVIDNQGRRQYVVDWVISKFTDLRGNSFRYRSRDAALYEAYMAKERYRWIADVDAEQIPNPRSYW